MKKFADYIPEAEALLAEKAVSQQQQKFMGMVHALQKGKKIKGASPELKKVARTMKKSDAKDFAKTAAHHSEILGEDCNLSTINGSVTDYYAISIWTFFLHSKCNRAMTC